MTYCFAILFAFCCYAACVAAQTPAPNAAPETDATAVTTRPQAYRPDERQPDKPYTVNIFGKPTELSLNYEVTHEWRRNFDLDKTKENGRNELEQELKLNARMRASDTVTLFAQLKGLADRRKDLVGGRVRNNDSLERGQTWVLVDRLADTRLSLQVGRIALIERRSWWWDDDLDAVRLNYSDGDWRLETGLARELARKSSAESNIDPAAKNVTRWFGNGGYRWAPRHTLEAYWLVANDSSGAPTPGTLFAEDTEDPSDARMRWFGLRATGEARYESGHRLGYRADGVLLRGRETVTPFTETDDGRLSAGTSVERRVRANAWDIGAYWRLPSDTRPTLSVGLANGSGSADGDTERNFRQTGLQENKGRIAGVKRLRYYGELVDPELSNLRIATLGFGLRFLDNSSIELLQHQYRQQVASSTFRGSRLSEDPEGSNRDIGREIDLFIAIRESRRAEITLLLSRFRPGAAFATDRRDAAHAIELGAAFNF
jgi:alginate production protein